jgi:hypothetical protein
MLFGFWLLNLLFPLPFVDQLFICLGIGQWLIVCCLQFLVLGLAWYPSLSPVVNAGSLAKNI